MSTAQQRRQAGCATNVTPTYMGSSPAWPTPRLIESILCLFPSSRPMPRTIFVTTALPYANGSFHIGHIMEYIQADTWVRAMHMAGHTVHFVGADDAHGAPIMLKAEAEGITPQALVGRYAAERPKYLDGFHIRFDHWHSTDSPENIKMSQEAVYPRAPKAAGFIDSREIEQLPIRSRACSCPTATSRANARAATPRTSTAIPVKSAAPSTARPS